MRAFSFAILPAKPSMVSCSSGFTGAPSAVVLFVVVLVCVMVFVVGSLVAVCDAGVTVCVVVAPDVVFVFVVDVFSCVLDDAGVFTTGVCVASVFVGATVVFMADSSCAGCAGAVIVDALVILSSDEVTV